MRSLVRCEGDHLGDEQAGRDSDHTQPRPPREGGHLEVEVRSLPPRDRGKRSTRATPVINRVLLELQPCNNPN